MDGLPIWLDDFTVTGPDVPNGGPRLFGVNPLAVTINDDVGKAESTELMETVLPAFQAHYYPQVCGVRRRFMLGLRTTVHFGWCKLWEGHPCPDNQG